MKIDSDELIQELLEKVNKLEVRNQSLKECVDFWKWGFKRLEEQNTNIILRLMGEDEQ